MKLYYLEVETWVGVSPDASHFKGRIVSKDRRRKPICSAVDKYFSKKEIIQWAVRWHRKQRRKEDCALILGSSCYAEPQLVLRAPLSYKTAANRLYRRAEAIGFWDGGHEKEMEAICAEWDRLNRES